MNKKLQLVKIFDLVVFFLFMFFIFKDDINQNYFFGGGGLFFGSVMRNNFFGVIQFKCMISFKFEEKFDLMKSVGNLRYEGFKEDFEFFISQVVLFFVVFLK